MLRGIALPSLSDSDRELMEAEFSTDEIALAIRSIRSGKATGPNGIPIELHKRCPDKMAPYLRAMFLESRENGSLPRDQRLASIVVIHKEGKP